MTTAIITMAGFGRRFIDAGYDIPKYRIVVHQRSLFAWSMLSLKGFAESGSDFVFVLRAADHAKDFILAESAALGLNVLNIVELDKPTDGQATTALAAGSAIGDPSTPMLIYNIDTFVHPSALPPSAVRGEGWIPCFQAQGDAWSFAAVDSSGRVREVREKQRISAHATIGLYWFSSFDLYADLYRRHYRDPANIEKGERYVAPLYNTAIADGRAVYIHEVPKEAVVPLGIPDDVERFRVKPSPMSAETLTN
jgi:dTDP-glucose pyrophosphorylase